MYQAVSPMYVFQTVYGRWETAPKLLIYDNACNALTYALRREPFFFRNTLWLVDSLHYVNHSNCNCGFNFGTNPYYKGRFSSVLSEIKNQKINKIKGNLMFMNWQTFINFVRFWSNSLNLEEQKRRKSIAQ